MSWGPLLVNLGVTAVTVAVLMLATFAYAMRTRGHAIMDTVLRGAGEQTGAAAEITTRHWARPA